MISAAALLSLWRVTSNSPISLRATQPTTCCNTEKDREYSQTCIEVFLLARDAKKQNSRFD